MRRRTVGPGRRRWRWARTLAGRLTIGTAAILILACVLLGSVTDLFLHTYLLDRLDGELSAAAGRFSASLEHATTVQPGGADGDADNAYPGQSVGTFGARLVTGRVTQAAVVEADGSNRRLTLDATDIAGLSRLPAGGPARSIELDAAGNYRVQAFAGRDGDVQVTGLPLHPINDILARLVSIEAVVFAALVAVGGAATVVVVRRGIRPLTEVTDAALALSQQPLTAALPWPQSLAVSPDPVSEPERLAVAFEAMYTTVHHALAERDAIETRLRQFIADASHELNTPLALIQAHAEYAVRPGTSQPERLASLARVTAAAGAMSLLVSELLLLARLDDGGGLELAPMDLRAVVAEAVNDARIAAPDHRWRLALPAEPVFVRGDAVRLRQVLNNLLGNAARHTPAGTTVATALSTDGDRVLLEVRDDGGGIPTALRDTLFDRFVRGDSSRSRASGSTGLGLAIARGIVIGHGGSISVESVPPASCFSVVLPAGS